MSRRVIWQCNRCLSTAEREAIPADWFAGVISKGPSNLALGRVGAELTWCEDCWKIIRTPLPLAVAQKSSEFEASE